MSRIHSTLKITPHQLFIGFGVLLLLLVLVHAGRTIWLVSQNPAPLTAQKTNPVEQSISKALDLIKNQTSSD